MKIRTARIAPVVLAASLSLGLAACADDGDTTVDEGTAVEDTAAEDTAMEDTAMEDTAMEDTAMEDTSAEG